MAENINKECAREARLHVAWVWVGPNLRPEVADGAAAAARDCGRTGGHSFCQTHWDWWSRLERQPGVFAYSNGRGRDSWTLCSALWACTCAYSHSAAAACVLLQAAERPVDCVSGTFTGPQQPSSPVLSIRSKFHQVVVVQILVFDDINVVLECTRAGRFVPEQLPVVSGQHLWTWTI